MGVRLRIVVFATIICFLASCTKAEERIGSGTSAGGIYVQKVMITIDPEAEPRVTFGAEKLADALRSVGYDAELLRGTEIPADWAVIMVGNIAKDEQIQWVVMSGLVNSEQKILKKEGFLLASLEDQVTVVAGGDDSGVLYGCMELAEKIVKEKKIPKDLYFADGPDFVLRGPCIGMQKTTIIYDDAMYDYPYTKENFPFFYDKEHWAQYLDFLLKNRMNTLYLWNGHPFPSLLRLEKYPEAQEVSDEQLAQNIEMFGWLTKEADKRGIWIIQFFYNIHISHPFARKHNVPYQHKEPSKLTSDYTRYCVSEFIQNYPHVGLMVCLGEALHGTENEIDWFTNTIIAGVKDGMKALELKEEPPIILRAHNTNPQEVMKAALPIYKNLYTTAKYNGESFTTWQPRGRWRGIHQDLSKLGSIHMVNVHILANLEPFRYGSPSFIQKCVKASRDILGARALHLYPLAYWDWPYSPDKTEPRIKQIDRDWIWFETWARYAWNPDLDPAAEREYWIGRLGERYGSRQAGEKILDAYEGSGECAPRILRRFGITGGNRQTMSLGMLMTQLINPHRYRVWPDLWKSDSPPGERLAEYIDREWKNEPHEGETPPQIVKEILQFSQQAVEAIDAAAAYVTKNKAEFTRLQNDIYCIDAMTKCYAAKAKAAMLVLRYKYSQDIGELEQALRLVKESLVEYRKLTALTEKTYLYANSLQNRTRKIPVDGSDGKGKHWTELLGLYEKEFENFNRNLAEFKANKAAGPGTVDTTSIEPLPTASFKLLSSAAEIYEVKQGAKVFTDLENVIMNVAPELEGLSGIRFSDKTAKDTGVSIKFEVAEPVKILIGYFQDKQPGWLQIPDLEVHAAADDRGGYEAVLRNAVLVEKLAPTINVHALRYAAGKYTLDLGKGSYLILGVIKQSAEIQPRLVFQDPDKHGLDWLFE